MPSHCFPGAAEEGYLRRGTPLQVVSRIQIQVPASLTSVWCKAKLTTFMITTPERDELRRYTLHAADTVRGGPLSFHQRKYNRLYKNTHKSTLRSPYIFVTCDRKNIPTDPDRNQDRFLQPAAKAFHLNPLSSFTDTVSSIAWGQTDGQISEPHYAFLWILVPISTKT
jgi:hypothetical protein